MLYFPTSPDITLLFTARMRYPPWLAKSCRTPSAASENTRKLMLRQSSVIFGNRSITSEFCLLKRSALLSSFITLTSLEANSPARIDVLEHSGGTPCPAGHCNAPMSPLARETSLSVMACSPLSFCRLSLGKSFSDTPQNSGILLHCHTARLLRSRQSSRPS